MSDTPPDAASVLPPGALVLLVDRADRLGRAGASIVDDGRGLARVASEAAALRPEWPLVLGVSTDDLPAVEPHVAPRASPYFTDVRRLLDLVTPLPARLAVLRPSALLLPGDVLRHAIDVCAGEALDLVTIAGIQSDVFYATSRRLVELLADCGPLPGATTIPEAVARLANHGVALDEAGLRTACLSSDGAAWRRVAAALPAASWREWPDDALLSTPATDRLATAARRAQADVESAGGHLAMPAGEMPRSSAAGGTLAVVSSMYQTGAHFAWMALARELSPRDAVFVVGGTTALHATLAARGIEVVALHDGLAAGSARDAATLGRTLARLAPAVVHLDGAECVPWAAMSRAAGARVVLHVRLNALDRFRGGFEHADAIVAVSSSMRAAIAGEVGGATRVAHIPDGVRLESYAPRDVAERPALDGGTPVEALVVGRVEPAKGQLRVIDIFEALATMRPARLTLVGPCGSDAAYCDAVRDRMASRPDDISWRPFSMPVDHLYRRAHVVLVGSRNEALGMVGLEAIAAGALLVAHRSIGYASIVDPGRFEGLLFEGHESAVDVATRIAGALDDLPTYSAAARRRATESFDAREVVRRLRALWHEVAAPPG